MTTSIDPATGCAIGERPDNSAEDLIAAVARARGIQPLWAARSMRERARHILRIRDYIADNAERICAVISANNGKTRVDALSTEVLPAAMAANYYAKHAEAILRPHHLRAGNLLLINKRSVVTRVPCGVVGIISPWNYPFAIPFHETMMALMAGNAVVLKAARQTQEVAGVLAETVGAAGLPEGLFSMVNVPGPEAGRAFVAGGVDKIFFTGSVAAGKELMALAAAKLIPVSLELGGNDAMIVCADANLYRAAAGAAWAGYSNCGQSCGGVERIYVERAAYDEYMRLLREHTRRLRFGRDTGFNVDVGAMTTAKQLETVTRHVEDALVKGAVAGAVSERFAGEQGGFYYPPTVLEGVREDMVTMQEETFGPVVAVKAVDSLEEAVRLANDSTLGLTASVWTRSRSTARSVAGRLLAGTVTINDHLMSHGMAETPWGGFKQSGIGRTHGYLGLEEMTQPRCVVDDILPGVQRNMWWYPHGPAVYAGLLGALHALYAREAARRLAGLGKMVRLFLRTFTRG